VLIRILNLVLLSARRRRVWPPETNKVRKGNWGTSASLDVRRDVRA
jgi:hypothetical protein